jgi:hypothetical protein
MIRVATEELGGGMDYVESLKAKRGEISAELEHLRVSRREVDERIAVREGQLRNIEELLALEGEEQEVQVDDPAASGHFMDSVVDELTASTTGMHYTDILRRVQARGVEIPGRDPGANLIAHMSRDARVVRVGRGTYAMAGSAPPTRPVRRRRAKTKGR